VELLLDDARALIRACQQEAAGYGKAITVAIVDAGGYLIALERQDGARPLTPSIAKSKAYTAAVMQRPGSMLKAWAESEPVFFSQVARMGLEPIVASDGAVPIKRDGELLGGLGVSGGRPEEDQAICESALAAGGFELAFDAWGQRR
jgi:uncharacterized protein GlcG (DUF336 family)